ncbi:hypothetical protein SRRS_08640 [Sporomusa rhizae]|uniref:hypothetical protein n=1 Tax=Sporomusa rhizae TaxID=357999 RepID=UPI00352AA322
MSDRVEKSQCPNLKINERDCTCPKKECPRHGYCCECVANHRKLGAPPLCFTQK